MAELVKAGDSLHGQTVAMILGQSASVRVYTTTDNQLRWDYLANEGHVPVELAPALSAFDGLMTEISTTVPKDRRAVAYAQLGKALFNALDAANAKGIEDSFKGVRNFVATCALHAARFRYIIAFLIASAILAASCLVLAQFVTSPPNLALLLTAAASGTGGAAMSVLYRSSRLALDPTAHTGFLILQGIARAILGALFGCFIVLACQGELILAFAKDHPLALYPLAVVAGYSERFVPEIMSHLEGTP